MNVLINNNNNNNNNNNSNIDFILTILKKAFLACSWQSYSRRAT